MATLKARRRKAVNPLRIDPSRTKTLRERFAKEVLRRFNEIKRELRKLVIEEDALGLRSQLRAGLVVMERWRFLTTDQKVEEFRRWLSQTIKKTVASEDEYWTEYVVEGYLKGAGRAFDDVKKIILPEPTEDFYRGTREEFLRQSFAYPVSTEKVKLLAGRVFSELNGVSEQLAQTLTRELADSLVRGQSPREVGTRLNKVVDGYKNRGLTIARTEIIRAHAEGQLDAFERLGVTKLGVAVEWSTTGDDRVCDMCAPLKGVVLTVKEARGLLPRHPNCRCAFIPANVGESQEEQKRSVKEIKEALLDSIRAELPKRKKRSLKEQIKRSRWVGADLKPLKKRPEPIIPPETPTQKEAVPPKEGISFKEILSIYREELSKLPVETLAPDARRKTLERLKQISPAKPLKRVDVPQIGTGRKLDFEGVSVNGVPVYWQKGDPRSEYAAAKVLTDLAEWQESEKGREWKLALNKEEPWTVMRLWSTAKLQAKGLLKTGAKLIGKKLPEELWKLVKRGIYFVRDPFFVDRFLPNVVTQATSNRKEGTVIAYRGAPLDLSVLFHELGHIQWGIAEEYYRDAIEEYEKAVKDNPDSPTLYGDTKVTEDFADLVSLYHLGVFDDKKIVEEYEKRLKALLKIQRLVRKKVLEKRLRKQAKKAGVKA